MGLYNFTDQINNIINDATNRMDFQNLSRQINDAVREDIRLSPDEDEPKAGPYGQQSQGYDYNRKYDKNGYKYNYNYTNANKTTYNYGPFRNRKQAYYSQKVPTTPSVPGKISSVVKIVCGSVLTAFNGFGVLSGLMYLAGLLVSRDIGTGVGILCSSGVFMGIGIVLMTMGIKQSKFVKRFYEYTNVIQNDEFVEIKNLADASYHPEKTVHDDLKKMIQKRFFLEGHLDSDEKYFIGNDRMYQQYLASQDSFNHRKAQQDAEAEKHANETEEERKLREVLEKGKESVAEIHAANDMLPGEHISAQLDELETLVSKIFERVAEKPSLLREIKQFMNYYLPTTLKLVKVYTDFEQKDIDSAEVKKARHDIEQTLDTIIEAFKKLLNELYEDTVMDVSSDISVLKAMFEKDGLGSDELKMK